MKMLSMLLLATFLFSCSKDDSSAPEQKKATYFEAKRTYRSQLSLPKLCENGQRLETASTNQVCEAEITFETSGKGTTEFLVSQGLEKGKYNIRGAVVTIVSSDKNGSKFKLTKKSEYELEDSEGNIWVYIDDRADNVTGTNSNNHQSRGNRTYKIQGYCGILENLSREGRNVIVYSLDTQKIMRTTYSHYNVDQNQTFNGMAKRITIANGSRREAKNLIFDFDDQDIYSGDHFCVVQINVDHTSETLVSKKLNSVKSLLGYINKKYQLNLK
ncbi:MAG: hypothetical protein H6621_03360 [Halobacteriovoraceae bacterium]|nr:hypothetical protein [Halobacteriovoraceae bacterium]MCB9094085.1 hypothetical protein [Halobacteriovoraceae bacterium]